MKQEARREKALGQIRSILAKAKIGSGATEEEAAAALQFARRMMLRHQIAEEELGECDRTPAQVAAQTEYDTAAGQSLTAKVSAWEAAVSAAISTLVGTVKAYTDNGTHLKRSQRGTSLYGEGGKPKRCRRVIYYGPAADARDAAAMWEEWCETILALARLKWGGAFRGEGRSYAEGFAYALLARARSMEQGDRMQSSHGTRREATLEARAGEDGAGCSALVTTQALSIMDAKRARCESWLEAEKGIRLQRRSASSGGRHHSGAYRDGQHDGRSAAFSRTRQGRLSQ